MTNKTYTRLFFENSILCGNCNGSGLQDVDDFCRFCWGTGLETFYQYAERQTEDLLTVRLKYNAALNQFQLTAHPDEHR